MICEWSILLPFREDTLIETLMEIRLLSKQEYWCESLDDNGLDSLQTRWCLLEEEGKSQFQLDSDLEIESFHDIGDLYISEMTIIGTDNDTGELGYLISKDCQIRSMYFRNISNIPLSTEMTMSNPHKDRNKIGLGISNSKFSSLKKEDIKDEFVRINNIRIETEKELKKKNYVCDTDIMFIKSNVHENCIVLCVFIKARSMTAVEVVSNQTLSNLSESLEKSLYLSESSPLLLSPLLPVLQI
jgi:hypothetical protein